MTKSWRSGESPWLVNDPQQPEPGVRVIVDNDFAGDPDDLYQIVHHMLSPSVDIRGVIGSHLALDDPITPDNDSAEKACKVLHSLFDTMQLDATDLVWQGSNLPLSDRHTPRESAAARAIVEEAMRDDVATPLYIACGGGLTDIASAWLMEPRIAEKLTVVWIGGPEYPGHAEPHALALAIEYNLNIDIIAAQVVFNDSPLPLWQVPRNIYRQCLVSDMELRMRVATRGDVGALLYRSITRVARAMWKQGAPLSETYALGDSPLVLLTALQSFFEPDTSSSDHVTLSAPIIDASGQMTQSTDGRPIRVYTRVDTRMMFEDMFLKLEAFAHWQASG